MTVGENIRRIRKEKGLTQKKLGELCGINEVQIRRYELGGKNSNPKKETLEKIANALGVQLYDLISNLYSADTPREVSIEHPIAFPGLEKKLLEIGYSIGYGCDYVETDDDDIWINYPEGKQIHITVQELEDLNTQADSYLKFLIEELKKKH